MVAEPWRSLDWWGAGRETDQQTVIQLQVCRCSRDSVMRGIFFLRSYKSNYYFLYMRWWFFNNLWNFVACKYQSQSLKILSVTLFKDPTGAILTWRMHTRSIQKSQNTKTVGRTRNQGFSYYTCLMIKGSGSGEESGTLPYLLLTDPYPVSGGSKHTGSGSATRCL